MLKTEGAVDRISVRDPTVAADPVDVYFESHELGGCSTRERREGQPLVSLRDPEDLFRMHSVPQV